MWILVLAACMSGFAQGPRAGRPERPPQQERPSYQPEELGSIAGVVRDKETGEPIRKVSLQAMPVNRGPFMNPPQSVTTDPEGRFVFPNLEPGEYRLVAERAGYVSQTYGAKSRMSAGTNLKIGKSEKLSNIEFKLVPHAVVTGRVVDEDGDPVLRCQVQLLRYMFSQGRRRLVPAGGTASTNDLGEYRIFGVAPGRYYLSAVHSPAQWGGGGGRTSSTGAEEHFAPTYYPGVADAESSATIDVGQGARLQSMDIRMLRTRTFTVSGRAIASQPTGRGGSVMLQKADGGSMAMSFERLAAPFQLSNGRFVVRGVPPGSYTLIASVFDRENPLSGRASVSVGESNVEDVTVTLTPGNEVTGVVKAEGQGEVSFGQTSISFMPVSNIPMMGDSNAHPDKEGNFRVKHAPRDRVWVTVSNLPDGYYVKSARAGDVDLISNELDLVNGTPASVEITVAAGAPTVQGTVADAKGKPAASAVVVLIPVQEKARERLAAYRRAQTDQTGAFTLKGMPPGEYYLIAADELEYGAESDPEFLKAHQSSAEKLVLKEGSQETRQMKLP